LEAPRSLDNMVVTTKMSWHRSLTGEVRLMYAEVNLSDYTIRGIYSRRRSLHMATVKIPEHVMIRM
jgi:hypothetical protein